MTKSLILIRSVESEQILKIDDVSVSLPSVYVRFVDDSPIHHPPSIVSMDVVLPTSYEILPLMFRSWYHVSLCPDHLSL